MSDELGPRRVTGPSGEQARPRRPARSRRGTRRSGTLRRVPLVVLVVVCIAAAGVLDRTKKEHPTTRPAVSTAAASGPTLPSANAVSTSWYCAEGTSAAAGRADETLYIANVGDEDSTAVITVLPPGQNAKPASREVQVPKRGQRSVRVADVLESPEQLESGAILGPGVIVEVFGGRSVVEHSIAAQNDIAVGPCARDAGREWYFGAGSTERGTEQYLSLFNPFPDDAIVNLSFVTDTGMEQPAELQSFVVARRTRATVPVQNFLRRHPQVAVHVEAKSGRVVAEQSLVFTPDNPSRHGITLSLGSPRLASSWTFSGGSSEPGASTTIAVANFDPAGTEVEVSPRVDSGATPGGPQTIAVGGRSVAGVDLARVVPAGSGYALQVRTTRPTPVVAEEVQSWASPATEIGAAAEPGSLVAAKRWAFALGRVDPAGDGLISVFNPGTRPVTVSLLRYESGRVDRPTSAPELSVPPGQRVVFDLRQFPVDPSQAIGVTADAPVFAEREIVDAQGTSVAPGVPDVGG